MLLVDASQGVEAQTLANAYLAVEHNLEIIPVINKIDLPGAQPEEARRQIEEIIGLDGSNAILTSAKEGIGITDVLEAVVARLPPPKGDSSAPLKALIFDSWYDPYRGVVIVARVLEGMLRKGTKIRLMARGQDYEIEQIGVFSPKPEPIDELGPGEVGFVVANIKTVSDAKIGDTITETHRPAEQAFPGFKELKPMVFAGLYPVESHAYAELREALEKLRLNDASFFFEPETSAALGFGFRCGFLGLLHMEIVQERLEREFNMDLVTTAPGVLYRVDDDRWAGARDRQPFQASRGQRREDRRAHHYGDDADAGRARGRDPAALPGKARRAEIARVSELEPRAHHLRAAVQRSRARFLRQAQDAVPRLRVARLSCNRLLGLAAGEDGHPRQRGSRGRACPSSCIATTRMRAEGRWRRRCAS